MLISKTYARFYRSLNHDYFRRDGETPEHVDPWERVDDGRWFPHVVVRLDPAITTIVGANEAGKTQVIDAVKAGLTGDKIRQSDFCRYSELFGVDAPVSYPEFGLELTKLDAADLAAANDLLGLDDEGGVTPGSTMWIFRTPSVDQPACGTVHWRAPGGNRQIHSVAVADLSDWSEFLPEAWTIDATVALPDSVPLQWLVDQKPTSATSRSERLSLVNTVLDNQNWFNSEASIQQHAKAISEQLNKPRKADAERLAQFEVARQLLVEVAGIDEATFVDLRDAIERTDEGHATALATEMNALIRKGLNPAKWWTQDPDFSLTVGLRDHDLVFTIRDRTGRDYTFAERSTGLRYFLSYLVQFLAGRPAASDAAKVLLMDEPDTYLSSRGQQDLLRVLGSAAVPDDPRFRPTQVVYVTHSPFLVDKNHAERVRVLDKGDLDEGTRVVDRAHHNRYEPLRSSLGPMVGETTFIGSRNIIVEGPSDQILVAGAAAEILRHGVGGRQIAPSDVLDLNDHTIVPAGGTPHVPYMAYLARGRGEERPPVVILLDSDKPGRDARAAIGALELEKQAIVADDLIVEIGQLPETASSAVAIEDLVPETVAAAAVDRYYEELGFNAPTLDPERIRERSGGLLERLNELVAEQATSPFELQKVAFARCVVEAVRGGPSDNADAFRTAFAPLVRELATKSQLAFDRERSGAIRKRMKRSIKAYANDHNRLSAREHAARLLDTLEALIDEGPNFEPARATVSKTRSTFALHANLGDAFNEHDEFVEEVRRVPDAVRRSQEEAQAGRDASQPAVAGPHSRSA